MVGDDIFDYDHAHCLVTSIDLPVTPQVMRASHDEPYLGVLLDINPRSIRDLMAEPGLAKPKPAPVGRGMAVKSRSPSPILDAVVRLVRLLETPQDIPDHRPPDRARDPVSPVDGRTWRAPAAHRRGGQPDASGLKGIDWIRKNFALPLRIELLARTVNMSISSLHHNFKAITGMSPLQYQKRLRLQEARRLMLAEMLDAAPAAHQVGYESHSQFSRR